MYWEIPQGSTLNIQGLSCHIPPEGFVVDIKTKQLRYIGVYKRSNIESEQYWERVPLPIWYSKVLKLEDAYEKKRKEDEEPFYNEDYEAYKQQEWDRRLNGFWFMNKGKAVYLTGFYYMLLQWFSIDIGFSKFIIPHLHKLYFLQYCLEDQLCMGMIDVTKRRFLKTFIGGLFILEYVTRTKMVNGALQSKTGNDAKKVFGKAIVYPFRKFPRFFRPEYDMSLGVNPKTEIRFQQTNIRGKKAEDSINKDELGSMIDWGSADPIHYDGQKLHRYFSDEWGKTTEANIFDRHEVIRYCLLDEEGKIIGKALYSTTVEKLDSDKDGVQEAAKDLWEASDQNNREQNGMTQSGLYRFFQTSDEGKNFDIYGYPDVEKTIKEILIDRDSVGNSARSLSARIRKEPRTIQEAFSTDGDKCIFNSGNIDKRETQLIEQPVYKRKVVFERGMDGKVVWRDIRLAEKEFHWEITQLLPKEESNKFEVVGKLHKPSRTHDGVITIDGYGNNQGGRKYGSKACAWIGRKHNILDPDNTFKAIGCLYGRPQEKSILHNQVMFAAEYFGYQAWFEHNSDEYDTHFKQNGKVLYLGIYPLSTIAPDKREDAERHRGFPTTPYSLTRQNDVTIAYFENYCHLIDFPDLFPHARKYDPHNRTAFDMVVSFEMLIVCLLESVYIPPPPKEPLIRIYDGQKGLGKVWKNPALADA